MNKTEEFNKNCSRFKETWLQSSSEFCLNMRKISAKEKQEKEQHITDIMEKVSKHMDSFPDNLFKRKRWKHTGEKFMEKLIEQDDLFKLENMSKEMREDFFKTTKVFIKEARCFDETLSLEDISQAIRNVWIVNILQVIIEEKPNFSDAIFGYSMLYPYTDNFLDDITIQEQKKSEFNKKLYKRLKGEAVAAQSSHEEKVFELISCIEGVYHRQSYPKVYESLLLIFEGQVKSLIQQDSKAKETFDKILNISIEKGGSSVLVDGYLIKGTLTPEQEAFCIGYGFFLQLADDLQDLKEDMKNNHETVMTRMAAKEKLDATANKLICFIETLVEDFNMTQKGIKELIKDDCILLVLVAAILNKEYFSEAYIEKIIAYLPFSMPFLEHFKEEMSVKMKGNSLEDNREKMMSIVDEMVG